MSTPDAFEAHPHLLRRQALIWTVVLGGSALVGWFMLPAQIRGLFTPFQVATLAFFLLVMLGIVWAVALGYVRADASGITFRNGVRTHHVGWDEVTEIRYNRADHWAFVELADDSDRMMLGIQRSDGRLADEQVARLRELHARYGRGPQEG